MGSTQQARRTSASVRLLALVVLTFVGALGTAGLLKAVFDVVLPDVGWLHEPLRYRVDGDGSFTYDLGRAARRWLALWAVVLFVGLRRWLPWGRTVREGWSDPARARHLGRGLLLGAVLVASYGGLLAASGTVGWRTPGISDLLVWSAEYLVAATVIAVVEETFFRAMVLGTMVRDWGTVRGTVAATTLFAALHTVSGSMHTAAGAEPFVGVDLLRMFVTDGGTVWFDLRLMVGLGLLGWLLARLTVHTGSIWAAIGVHGSLVFASKLLKKVAIRNEEFPEAWLGDRLFLLSGVATWALLAVAIVAGSRLVVEWAGERRSAGP